MTVQADCACRTPLRVRPSGQGAFCGNSSARDPSSGTARLGHVNSPTRTRGMRKPNPQPMPRVRVGKGIRMTKPHIPPRRARAGGRVPQFPWPTVTRRCSAWAILKHAFTSSARCFRARTKTCKAALRGRRASTNRAAVVASLRPRRPSRTCWKRSPALEPRPASRGDRAVHAAPARADAHHRSRSSQDAGELLHEVHPEDGYRHHAPARHRSAPASSRCSHLPPGGRAVRRPWARGAGERLPPRWASCCAQAKPNGAAEAAAKAAEPPQRRATAAAVTARRKRRPSLVHSPAS